MNDRSAESIKKLQDSIELIDQTFGRDGISTEDIMTLAQAREQCSEFIGLVELLRANAPLQASDIEVLNGIDEYALMVLSELSVGRGQK